MTIRIADPSSQEIFRPLPLPATIAEPRKQSADAPTTLAAWAGRQRVYRFLLAILGLFALLLFWHFAVRWALLPVQILPAPEAVARSLVDLATSGKLASNLAISVRRVALGFLIGAGAGLLLGSAMGLSAKADRFLRPTFLVISQIPVLGWLPFLMLLLGIGEALKIVIIAKAAFTPVTLNTLNGFRAVPDHYLEVARIYRFSPWQLLGKVMLPAAFPPIFTGLRYGLTHSWLSLVAVELLASTEGVGYLMVWSRQLFQLDTMIAMMVVVGFIGFLMDRLLSAAEAFVLRRYGGSLT